MILCRHDSVKITHLNKSLAALVILFFFVLGAVAVSTAQESSFTGEVESAVTRLIIDDAPARVQDSRNSCLWQLPVGDLPNSGYNDADRRWFIGQRFPVPIARALLSNHRASKVSLHMLQPILLL